MPYEKHAKAWGIVDKLSVDAQHTLSAIVSYQPNEEEVCAELSELSRHGCTSISTIRQGLLDLEGLGLIEIEKINTTQVKLRWS